MIFYMYIFPLFPIVCSCSPCITEGTAQAVVLLAFLMFPHHEISTCLLLKTTLPCIPFPTLLKESTQKPKLCLSLKYVRTSKNAFIKKCDAASFCVCVGGAVCFGFVFVFWWGFLVVLWTFKIVLCGIGHNWIKKMLPSHSKIVPAVPS